AEEQSAPVLDQFGQGERNGPLAPVVQLQPPGKRRTARTSVVGADAHRVGSLATQAGVGGGKCCRNQSRSHQCARRSAGSAAARLRCRPRLVRTTTSWASTASTR